MGKNKPRSERAKEGKNEETKERRKARAKERTNFQPCHTFSRLTLNTNRTLENDNK